MINTIEYETRYANRIYGKRKARVVDNKDPERRGRVRVENRELFGASQSPWALPCMPLYGGRDSGFFAVPPVGSFVWLEFEEGLIDHPIYAGGYYGLIDDGHPSDGSEIESESGFQSDPSHIPPHARGVYDGSDFGNLKGANGVPDTTFEGKYGDVMIWQSPAGHMIEMDDHEGSKRIQIHHAKGAHIEILDDGSINIISGAQVRTRSLHRSEVVIDSDFKATGGSRDEEVGGDFSKKIVGTSSFAVGGDTTFSARSSSVTLETDLGLEAGSLTAQLLNNFSVDSGGALDFSCFGNLDVVAAGLGYLVANNATSAPQPVYLTEAFRIVGTNGTTSIVSADPSQNVSVYGMEARGGASAQVTLGNLSPAVRTSLLGVGPIPLTKESVVLGQQLKLFLDAVMSSLSTFYGTMSTGGAAPGYGGPDPVMAIAATTAKAALDATALTYLSIPSPTQPLILSESVYVSKV